MERSRDDENKGAIVKKRVEKALQRAVDKARNVWPDGMDVPDGGEQALGDALDSMGIVTLVGLFEMELQSEFGRNVVLADERAFSEERSPFSSLAALSAYAEKQLKNE